jgi:hypothetical protein
MTASQVATSHHERIIFLIFLIFRCTLTRGITAGAIK